MKSIITTLIIGLIFLGTGRAVPSDYYSDFFFFMGIGILSNAAVQIFRRIYWKLPKHQAEYEAKKKEDYINSVDERKQYLRMKSGHVTYQIMTFGLIILTLLLTFFRAETWVIVMVFLLFILNWIIGILVFRILEKRF